MVNFQSRKTKLSGNFVTQQLKQQIQMKSWLAETSGDFETLRMVMIIQMTRYSLLYDITLTNMILVSQL